MKTRYDSQTAAAAARSSTKKPKVVGAMGSMVPDDDVYVRELGSEAVLIACIEGATPDGSALQHGRFLIISPTAGSFDELSKQSPFISELWILAAGTVGRGVSYIDRIDEVASWTACTPGGRPLIVLRGRGGHLLGVDDNGIFPLRPSSVHWSGEGCYRGAPDPANANTV
jgi:hypothetical protein